MKVREREQVRQLRRQGLSYSQIRQIVGVSKSSISLWTRDIELLPKQKDQLKSSRVRRVEKYSETRRRQREAREAVVYAEAEVEYATLSRDPTFMYGLALYVGEGAKTSRGRILLSNCDPRVLRKFVRFMELLGVRADDLRIRIYLHPHRSEGEALGFWSREIGLPVTRFGRTATAVSSASKGLKADKQPYGTCSVYYDSMELWLKMKTWMTLSLL